VIPVGDFLPEIAATTRRFAGMGHQLFSGNVTVIYAAHPGGCRVGVGPEHIRGTDRGALKRIAVGTSIAIGVAVVTFRAIKIEACGDDNSKPYLTGLG